jgi:hypothetical protein
MPDVALSGTDARPILLIHDERELIAAIRARLVELNITYSALDLAALLPDGYTSKLLAPEPMKHMGGLVLWSVLGTLGYRIALVHDEELLARFRARLTPRERAPQASGRAPPVTYALTHQFLRKIGRLGAAKSHAVASKKRHISKVNRANALKRWHKPEISED